MPEMPDDELRNALDAIVARLQSEVQGHLTQVEQRHQAARDRLLRETEARVQAQTTEMVAAEWAAKLEQARAESDARLRAELAEAAVTAAEATASADRRVAAETARLLAEAEQAASALTNRHEAERERAIAEAVARVREELGRERHEAVQQAQREANERVQTTEREANERVQTIEREANERVQTTEREANERVQTIEREAQERAQTIERNAQERIQTIERDAQQRVQTVERAMADAAARASSEHESAVAGERQQWASERDRLLSDAESDRRRAGALSASVDELQAALAAEKLARESVQAALAASESREQARLEDQSTGARVEERQAKVALVEQLMGAVRAVSEARSLSDTLNALAAAAASLAPRIALFIVNERNASRELQGWRAAGFADPSPALLHLAVDDGGLLATATASKASVSTSTVSAPDFASLPPDRAGLAVPLTVGGKTVAVLYADDGGTNEPEAPSSWPEAMQILGVHASVCLSHITAVRTTQAMRATMTGGRSGEPMSEEDHSARRYARLLVSEIKLYNEAAVRTGREKRDLLSRLAPEIERARRLYEERIPSSILARGKYFQEELVHTLADGDAALLGSA
jgi:hypothetical protein